MLQNYTAAVRLGGAGELLIWSPWFFALWWVTVLFPLGTEDRKTERQDNQDCQHSNNVGCSHGEWQARYKPKINYNSGQWYGWPSGTTQVCFECGECYLGAITQQAPKLSVTQGRLMISRNAQGQIKLCFFFNQGRRQTNMEVSHQDSSLKSHLETRTKILTSRTITVPNPLAENTNGIQSTTKHPKHPANFGITLL